MIVTIDNYKYKSDIEIYTLSDTEITRISYNNLNIENNIATINNFNFKEDIYRIEILEDKIDDIELIYKFYDNDKIIHEVSTIDCSIQIKNNLVYNYDTNKFLDDYEEKLNILDFFNDKQWNLYWYYLHWFTYNYPNKPTDKDKKEVKKLVNVMRKDGIKCDKCRKHFNNWLNTYDINSFLNNRRLLFTYFFKLHNKVNKQNKKKILSLHEATNIYKSTNWNKKLKKYGINIINLFRDRKLETFPELFYTVAEENLKKEHNLT